MERRCRHCGERFIPRKNVPRQTYCSKVVCQEARRRRWRQRKLLDDPDYRGNQYDAQKEWRENHRDYWSRYRASHPEYAKRNRALQRERNHRRRGTLIAKSDELTYRYNIASGYYWLTPAGGKAIAKSNECLVKLDVFPGACPHKPARLPDCKQIT